MSKVGHFCVFLHTDQIHWTLALKKSQSITTATKHETDTSKDENDILLVFMK